MKFIRIRLSNLFVEKRFRRKQKKKKEKKEIKTVSPWLFTYLTLAL
jgi:hypothetical protein